MTKRSLTKSQAACAPVTVTEAHFSKPSVNHLIAVRVLFAEVRFRFPFALGRGTDWSSRPVVGRAKD
jgi:hypothetical protein